MMTPVLGLHLIFAGLWLGCVLTEVLFERALLGKGRTQELILAALHKKVDVFVEIPAFLGVLFTGGAMLHAAAPSSLLTIKVALGGLAILANVYCVWLVFKRDRYASGGDWSAFESADRIQHKAGAIVLFGILGALAIGVYLHAHV